MTAGGPRGWICTRARISRAGWFARTAAWREALRVVSWAADAGRLRAVALTLIRLILPAGVLASESHQCLRGVSTGERNHN